jgi:hypothetical protein
MRFFAFACLFCLAIASVGCATKNWSVPIFPNKLGMTKQATSEDEPTRNRYGQTGSALEEGRNFWKGKFGQAAGLDPRAREIERRLGLE